MGATEKGKRGAKGQRERGKGEGARERGREGARESVSSSRDMYVGVC